MSFVSRQEIRDTKWMKLKIVFKGASIYESEMLALRDDLVKARALKSKSMREAKADTKLNSFVFAFVTVLSLMS